MIPGYQNMEDNDTIEKYCYLNIPANCEKYGGLYKWDEMMKYETKIRHFMVCKWKRDRRVQLFSASGRLSIQQCCLRIQGHA